LLLSNGAHVNADPAQGGVPALQAAIKSSNTEIIQKLISKGADINAVAQCQGSRTALQTAAEKGNQEIIDLLLMMGARINTYEGTSHTSILQGAAQGGNLDIVQEILKRGFQANNSSPANLVIGAALRAASAEGHAEIVRLLLRNGADVTIVAPNTGGFISSALLEAAQNGHLDVVKILVTARADVNAVGSESFAPTALQAAAANGHLEISNVLLNNGADVNRMGFYRGNMLTVLESAIEYGHVGIIQRLLEHRVNVYNEIALAEATGNLVVLDMLNTYKESGVYAEV
jgi:ankyrin repeat protein